MPPKLNIEPGMLLGMWMVLRYEKPSKWGSRLYRCRCECGREGIIAGAELWKGNSKSCGCVTRFTSEYARTHGQSDTKLYKVWSSMKQRCSNPKDLYYYNYGGRGIKVCNEWQVFELFYEWAMTTGYKVGATLERKDNNKGYSPINCTWIPKPEQSNNTRRCRMITFQGETHNIKEWSQKLGVSYSLIQSRIKHGWNIVRALTDAVVPRHLCHSKRRMKREVQAATGIPTKAC